MMVSEGGKVGYLAKVIHIDHRCIRIQCLPYRLFALVFRKDSFKLYKV